MLLSDVFRRLKSGELESYFVGSDLIDSIGSEYWPQMIDNINMALTKMHTKFPLIEQQVVLQQYEHIAVYTLDSQFAETNTTSNEPYKYIKDSKYEPFNDNILRIDRVYNECMDYKLPINDPNDCCSVFTPAYNKLQVPTPEKENALIIVYRGDHTQIPVTVTDPTVIKINIPKYLDEALLAYVGHRYLSGKNTELTSNLSSKLYAKYLSICNEIEERNLVLQAQGGINTHPEIQGWI